MADVTETQILEALKEIRDPDRGSDIVTLGMVSGLQVRDGHVAFAVEVDAKRGPQLEGLRKQAEGVVHRLPGVLSATVVLTAERPAEAAGGASGPAPGAARPPAAMLLPEIGAIVAITSGKGGVGKSTTAVNLALALHAGGFATGVLDADIYGPSIPRMLGISARPTTTDDNKLEPMENYGIKCMSMGFLVDEETPMVWRGPMVGMALEQMMRDVNWGALDILVVDMPPGTGDAQLTMAQRVPLAGAVIVSTPQDISLVDARKGLNMFRKVDVPVLGIVENMSYFVCPHCGTRSEIFDHGGARREADRLEVDFLGEIPLDMAIRETSDSGHPIVVSDPEGDHAKAYLKIARTIGAKIAQAREAGAASRPRIVVE
ncbi:MAG: Mrp/NBP35 family ATP-binding protein [Rhodospirillales bacterium]|jgi:ATP-binding protein involved in chromosome partitioning|nr:Mrp/NBP35 family ATP-binding protein [Rhodospirillales bacterium]